MGITRYLSWLRQEFHTSFKKGNEKIIYDYIYVDVNHLLHSCISKCSFQNTTVNEFKEGASYKSLKDNTTSVLNDTEKDEFIHLLYHEFNKIFKNYIAKKGIVLAIDGPSSYSKIALQRERRKWYEDSNTLDSLALTPGTLFMMELTNYLQNYIDNLKRNYRYLTPTIEILGADLPDEGEIKILQKLIKYGTNNNNSHLIVSNDADVVVISISTKHIKNIYLLVQHEIINVNEIIEIFNSKIINFDNEKSKENYNVDHNLDPNLDNNFHKYRSDYALLSIMLGNDYLPGILSELKKNKNDNTIKNQIYDAYLESKKDNNVTLVDDSFNLNLTLLSKIMEILSKNRKNTEYNRNHIKNYLEGLLWCLHMYQTGNCSKYDYYISGGTINPKNINTFIKEYIFPINVPFSDTPSIPAHLYTLLLIPKNGIKYIPPKYQTLVTGKLQKYFKDICNDCLIHKNNLKDVNKKIGDNNQQELNKLETLRKFINKQYNEHKKSHDQVFDVKDMNYIIKIGLEV